MESRKEHIYRTAAKLFRRQGYTATTMRMIAKEVGIKAPSIYNHVRSKQDLLRDLLMKVANSFVSGMKEIYATNLDASGKLQRLVSLYVQMTIEHTDAVALIAREWHHLEEENKRVYLHLRNQYERMFRKIIDDGKAQGVIRAVDTDVILFSVLSTLRWLYSWYSRNREFDPLELERQLSVCLLEGIQQ